MHSQLFRTGTLVQCLGYVQQHVVHTGQRLSRLEVELQPYRWTVLLGPPQCCGHIGVALLFLQVIHKCSAPWQKHGAGWGFEGLEQCIVHRLPSRCHKLDFLHPSCTAYNCHLPEQAC